MFKKWDKQSVYFGVKTQTLVFRVWATKLINSEMTGDLWRHDANVNSSWCLHAQQDAAVHRLSENAVSDMANCNSSYMLAHISKIASVEF